MASILAHGACEERLWPFQKAMCTIKPTEHAYRDAQRFQAVQYARTPLGPAAQAALDGGLPVVFGTYIPGRFYDEAGRSGVMPEPSEQVERPGSGHAMLLVGYDAVKERWLARNSWGEGWAEGGYCWIPFKTLKAYSDPTHFWTIGTIDQVPTLALRTNEAVRYGKSAEVLKNTAASSGFSPEELRSRARSILGDQGTTPQGTDDATRQSLRDRLRGS